LRFPKIYAFFRIFLDFCTDFTDLSFFCAIFGDSTMAREIALKIVWKIAQKIVRILCAKIFTFFYAYNFLRVYNKMCRKKFMNYIFSDL